MRQRPAEITVFLSLTLVCILSLFMGLLESARTAGARLYLQMAADSALSSVMSQYNRKLWDEYRLLFLEYESKEAVEQSFEEFFDFYLDQENLYPMEAKEVTLTGAVRMDENGGEALEKEILSYIQYRLPEAAADLTGIAGEAAEAATAGDFKNLLTLCREVGKETRKLERKRTAIESALSELGRQKEKAENSAERESKGGFRSAAKRLKRELERFPGHVLAYEKELRQFTARKEGIFEGGTINGSLDEPEKQLAISSREQERLACGEVIKAAEENLKEYQKMERILEESTQNLEEALLLLDTAEANEESDDGEGGETDWDGIRDCLTKIEIPAPLNSGMADEEKTRLLDRLESLLDRDILELVLPEGAEASGQKTSLKGIPSARLCSAAKGSDPLKQLLIHEYILLSFDSFLEKQDREDREADRELLYEQEYILCGRAGDRENLKETAERLLAVRGGLNLLYLLNSPDLKAQADAFAAAAAAGNAPVQLILSFFILTLWAFGEAVADLRCLFAGGRVPLWKNADTWRTSLDGLLALDFLNQGTGREPSGPGRDYADYMRILFCLENREVRNFRMMDLIQWNIRKKQADFAVADCAYELSVAAEVSERHLFLLKGPYVRTVTAAGSY